MQCSAADKSGRNWQGEASRAWPGSRWGRQAVLRDELRHGGDGDDDDGDPLRAPKSSTPTDIGGESGQSLASIGPAPSADAIRGVLVQLTGRVDRARPARDILEADAHRLGRGVGLEHDGTEAQEEAPEQEHRIPPVVLRLCIAAPFRDCKGRYDTILVRQPPAKAIMIIHSSSANRGVLTAPTQGVLKGYSRPSGITAHGTRHMV